MKTFLSEYRHIKDEEGFTFIELILYMGILSVFLIGIVNFAWNVIEGGIKSSTEQTVYSNARFVSEQMKYQIRNASGINSLSANQISLISSTSANNPTVIGLSNGNITMQLGSGSPVNLNSQNTSISALTFTNLSSSDNKTENIQFTFTINASNSGATRQEFTDTTTIESDAEIRSN